MRGWRSVRGSHHAGLIRSSIAILSSDGRFFGLPPSAGVGVGVGVGASLGVGVGVGMGVDTGVGTGVEAAAGATDLGVAVDLSVGIANAAGETSGAGAGALADAGRSVRTGWGAPPYPSGDGGFTTLGCSGAFVAAFVTSTPCASTAASSCGLPDAALAAATTAGLS